MRMRLTLVVLLTGCLVASPLLLRVQSQRGQGVRIKVENGQEIDLYDESHALVIGVRKYTNGWRELPGAEKDAEAIGALLRRQGFEVTVVLSPTSAQLTDALSGFISERGLKERNRLVIYFAGHGYTEVLADGRELGYIVPADAPLPEGNPQLFSRLAISMDEIEAKALRIRSKHALFVFDSCFSGSIFDMRGERYVPPEIESKTAAPVRMFITAGTKNQTVPDDSIFRLYFVRAFEHRQGDLNRDGYITGEELGMYLAGRVASDTRDTQTPRYGKIKDAHLNRGDIVFALPRREVPPPAPTPGFDPAAIELAMWQSADRNNNVSDYEEYLRQYPQGRFAVMARNRIARLRPSVPNTSSSSNPAATVRMSVAGVRLTAMSFRTAQVNAQGQVINRRQEQCWGYVEDLGNGVKLEMVEIPAGEFLMGEDPADAAELKKECERRNDMWCIKFIDWASPQHRVSINGFLMGKYEVTQRQWKAVMGNLPSAMSDLETKFKGDDLPVVWVSWDEAQTFLQRLGRGYRLPSEAEWEYAARAGSRTAYAFGPTVSLEVVNYNKNSPSSFEGIRLLAVGSLGLANAWGLYDMHGNIDEWCEDVWHDSYNGAPTDGRAWVDISGRGSRRVVRGGVLKVGTDMCRSWSRGGIESDLKTAFNGFRLVRK